MPIAYTLHAMYNMYQDIISVGGWRSLTQSLGLRLRFAIAHLNFLLLIHSRQESSKPLCDGCHQ